jgi:hypothetical protein
MLMRDPWLGQGPDGGWHMLWTWGWTAKEMGGKLKIGYASSKDLIHWSPQRAPNRDREGAVINSTPIRTPSVSERAKTLAGSPRY